MTHAAKRLPAEHGQFRVGGGYQLESKKGFAQGCFVQHKPQPGEDRWFSLPGVLGQDKAKKIV